MRQSRSERRKRGFASSTAGSSGTCKTKSTTAYSGEFEQKMIDRGVYPKSYRAADGSRPPKPENMQAICDILGQPRPSLSPSMFSKTVFEDFQDSNERASSESKAMADVIPVIAGSKDKQYNTAGDILFNRLEKFDLDVSVPKPDIYYGAKPAQISTRIRRDLERYIIPSGRTNLPAAPNFFVEGKSASGKPDVAQRLAMHDGAVGARGMFKLQNYGNSTAVYDGKAYTISATYHPGTGTLQMYATHPRQSTDCSREAEYYMTQLDGYYMIGTSDGFRKGAAAYRNAREYTQHQRDHFIANANSAAQSMSTDTRSFSMAESSTTVSVVATEDIPCSETSADELAPDYDTATKRQRRATSPQETSALSSSSVAPKPTSLYNLLDLGVAGLQKASKLFKDRLTSIRTSQTWAKY